MKTSATSSTSAWSDRAFIAVDPYTGTYHDGKTSRGHSAVLRVLPGHLEISFAGEAGDPVTVTWQKESIAAWEQKRDGRTVVTYGTFPFQYVEVTDPAFRDTLHSAWPGAPFLKTGYLSRLSVPAMFAYGAGFVALVSAIYFLLIPFLVDGFARRLPHERERELGDLIRNRLLDEFEVDTPATLGLNRFFGEMRLHPRHPVIVTVVRGRELNAFAIPGGYLFVFDTLLHAMDRPEQMAGLLAHEYAHIELKHSVRAMARALSGYLFLSVLLGDVSGVTAVLVQNAESLKSLQYSRKLEEEADRYGMELMARAGIDPQGMPDLLRKLETFRDDAPLEMISSHPLLKHRIDYLETTLGTFPPRTYRVDLDSLWNDLKSK